MGMSSGYRLGGSGPDDLEVYVEVRVDEAVARVDHDPPGDVWMGGATARGAVPGSHVRPAGHSAFKFLRIFFANGSLISV